MERAILQYLVEDFYTFWDESSESDHIALNKLPPLMTVRLLRPISQENKDDIEQDQEKLCHQEHGDFDEKEGCPLGHMFYNTETERGYFYKAEGW